MKKMWKRFKDWYEDIMFRYEEKFIGIIIVIVAALIAFGMSIILGHIIPGYHPVLLGVYYGGIGAGLLFWLLFWLTE